MLCYSAQTFAGAGQVWFPTDRNMAGCDSCSFWVHDHCDEAAGTAIEFGDAVTYYCPPCRRQADAHHKLQVCMSIREDL